MPAPYQVERLRLSRSKKTGGSKGYAFIDFRDVDDARVVADAMVRYSMQFARFFCFASHLPSLVRAQDTYLLAGKQLVVKQLPNAKVHKRMWEGANEKFRPFPWREHERERHNKVGVNGPV